MKNNKIFYGYFIIVMLFYTADLITTRIGLSLGAYETNPWPAYLFHTFGDMGYIFSFLIVSLVIFLFLYGCEGLLVLYNRMTDEQCPVFLHWFVFTTAATVFCLGELNAIINNIFVIFQLI